MARGVSLFALLLAACAAAVPARTDRPAAFVPAHRIAPPKPRPLDATIERRLETIDHDVRDLRELLAPEHP